LQICFLPTWGTFSSNPFSQWMRVISSNPNPRWCG
jgi:hypothetical protein